MVCEPSTAPNHPDLRVKYLEGHSRHRVNYCFTKLSNEVNFGVYDVNIHTLYRAVLERVFYVCKDGEYVEPPRPDKTHFLEQMEGFQKQFKQLAQYTTPMQPMHFALTYQGRRRAVYIKAVEDNLKFGFDPKSAHIRAFVKTEKYNFSAKLNPVPRVIQPRDSRYLAEAGRYIKPIEKKIYKNIDTILGEASVYKGLNMVDRGNRLYAQWSRYTDPVAVGLDASRFDEHVSNTALEWEHKCYQAFYPDDKYFKMLMSLQRMNIGTGYTKDGCIRYKTKHNRMSGDPNTSSGNVLLMCAMVYSYREYLNMKFSLANDGDDCVIIMEREDYERFASGLKDYFLSLGFNMTVEPMVDTFEEIEFCQSHPVRNCDGGYTMVRDIRVSMSKDAVSLKPLDHPRTMLRWMAAVGKGGLSLTAGMPIAQSYYNYFIRHSQGATPLSDPTLEGGFFRNGVGMEARNKRITPESRCSFWLAFGIPPQSQLAIEEYLDNLGFDEGSPEDRFTILPMAPY